MLKVEYFSLYNPHFFKILFMNKDSHNSLLLLVLWTNTNSKNWHTGFSLQKMRYFMQRDNWGCKHWKLCITGTQKINSKQKYMTCTYCDHDRNFQWTKEDLIIFFKRKLEPLLINVFCILDVKKLKSLSICDWNWKTHTLVAQNRTSGTLNFFLYMHQVGPLKNCLGPPIQEWRVHGTPLDC